MDLVHRVGEAFGDDQLDDRRSRHNGCVADTTKPTERHPDELVDGAFIPSTPISILRSIPAMLSRGVAKQLDHDDPAAGGHGLCTPMQHAFGNLIFHAGDLMRPVPEEGHQIRRCATSVLRHRRGIPLS